MVLFININLNQRVEVKHKNRIYKGTVKYKGCINEIEGDWVGVVLDRKVGDNNGTLGARSYFECAEGHGIFTTANNIRFIRLQRNLYHNYQTVAESFTQDELFGEVAVNISNKPSKLPNKDLDYIQNNFKGSYDPQSRPPDFSLRGSISSMMPTVQMKKAAAAAREASSPRRATSALGVVGRSHPGGSYPQRHNNSHQYYNMFHSDEECDSDEDDTFISKPTIPKPHMPHSCMRHQVAAGWGQAHIPRYYSVHTARHAIKRAHHWCDID